MKKPFSVRSLSLTTCALSAATLCAQEAVPYDFDDPTIQKNRISLGVKFAFGLSAELRNVSYTSTSAPDYDDGFVRTDVSGNAGGKTWYWGYEDDNQVSGDSLLMHTLNASPWDGYTQDLEGEIMPGVELTYGRELKRWPLKNERAIILGAELAISALDVEFKDQATLSGNVSRTTSAFGLDGVVPPGAPYSGTYNGPGPLIDATPSSVTTDSVAVTAESDARVRSHVYGLRLGPFFEMPIAGRFNLQVSAGAAMMYANTTLWVSETITFDSAQIGEPPGASEVDYSEGEFLFGFYGRALVGFDFNPSFRAYLGIEYMSLGETSVTGGGKEATLQLGNAFQGVVGVQLLF